MLAILVAAIGSIVFGGELANGWKGYSALAVPLPDLLKVSMLMAFGFGTLLSAYPLANRRTHHVAKVVKIWLGCIVLTLVLWLLPFAFSLTFGGSSDSAFSFGLGLVLICPLPYVIRDLRLALAARDSSDLRPG